MRKYSIRSIADNKIDTIIADNPKDAIRQLYKKYTVDINNVSSNKASHVVELVGGSRESVSYYSVKVIGLDRKAKPHDYIEHMPKKQLRNIIKHYKEKGVLILTGDDVDEFLKKQGAEGSTLNESTILLIKRPSRSAVYEELIHVEQYRKNKNDGSLEKRLKCEIGAQEILIAKKEAYGITDAEDRQTRAALEAYKKEYEQFIKRRQ